MLRLVIVGSGLLPPQYFLGISEHSFLGIAELGRRYWTSSTSELPWRCGAWLFCGSSVGFLGLARLGSSFSVLDGVQLRSSMAWRHTACLGSLLSVLHLFHLGASLSLRSSGRSGFFWSRTVVFMFPFFVYMRKLQIWQF